MKISQSIIGLCMLLQSCSIQVEKINIGKDQCHFCKMTIADARYGGAILTKKGKTYKFDDLYCLQSFVKEELIEGKEIKKIFIQNYNASNELLDINLAYIIENASINGPMNGHWAAFSTKEVAKTMTPELIGKVVSEKQILK